MLDRCARCGWGSPAGSEYCRRCGQGLLAATRVPAVQPLTQAVSTLVEIVPPAVWRGAAALAAGAAIELARRLLAQRLVRPAVVTTAERALAPDPEVVRQVARDGSIEVTEVVIYRRITRRR